MSYLFVLRTAPDVDHIAPVAWKLLEEGQQVHAVLSPGLDADRDHRLRLLQGYPGFRLHPAGGGPLRAYARQTLFYAFALLVTLRVRCVGVEWGSGLPEAYERPRSRKGLTAFLRTLVGSLVPRNRASQQLRTNFIAAARLLGVSTVCLPHGLNVKLDTAPTNTLVELLAKGPLPWADRNRFTAFVLNTEQQRQWLIDHASADPEVMQTWGSVRWCPQWFELNRRLSPTFQWPEATNRLRVVYMVPKWGNRVHVEAAVQLLAELQALDFVSVAVMGHPRATSDARLANGDSGDPLRESAAIDWGAIHDVTGVNAVSLIEASDVVVDIGSSIGVEVLMQGKVLVNPTYLHELTTFFDTIEGIAVVAQSADEVTGYLQAHANGSPYEVEPAGYSELMRQAVYGSRSGPFDVLEEYASHLARLAGDEMSSPQSPVRGS